MAESRTARVRRVAVSRRFLAGVVCGALLVFVARWVINRTPLVDYAMAPLLLDDSDGRGDAIVALGAGVVGPCVSNSNSVRRALLAAKLWHEQRAPMILFTGGPHERPCKVAQSMAEVARLTGVPDSAIRVETVSRSTHENGEASAPLLRVLGVRHIIAVTDRLHMRRAQGVFAKLGFTVEPVAVPIYEGHENNVSMLYWGTREAIALGYYRMRGWIGTGATVTAASQQGVPMSWPRQESRYPDGPVVMLGASYAGNWDLKSFANVEVVNRGVAGQQSFEFVDRFERDVVAAKPRLVLIWGFINDISRSSPETMDASLERVRQSYVRMLAMARANGIPVALATELTIRPPDSWAEWAAGIVGRMMGKVSYQDRVNRHVLDVNRWLLDFAAKEGVPVFRFQELLSDESGRRRAEFIQPDGSHVTPSAYAALTAYARPILEAHVATR